MSYKVGRTAFKLCDCRKVNSLSKPVSLYIKCQPNTTYFMGLNKTVTKHLVQSRHKTGAQ